MAPMTITDLPETTNPAMPPKHEPSSGQPFGGDQGRSDLQRQDIPADSSAADQTITDDQSGCVGGGSSPREGHLCSDNHVPSSLSWAHLTIYADVLDDLEKTRIANENRLRSLRQVKGMEDTPEDRRMQAIVDGIATLEHDAELLLQRAVRAHPFGPWIKATVGIGAKQGARLLAAIGDPYWKHTVAPDGTVTADRPRRGPAELWAYCGYHVLHPGHSANDAHSRIAGMQPLHPGQQSLDTHRRDAGVDSLGSDHMPSDSQDVGVGAEPCDTSDQIFRETQGVTVAGVAPRRTRGHRANWNDTAKMRAHLCAESCIKQAASPYRPLYEKARIKYADAVHTYPCARCGPKDRPAPAGTPLSLGHQHARGLRIVAKEILKDLWLEGRRLHQEGIA